MSQQAWTFNLSTVVSCAIVGNNATASVVVPNAEEPKQSTGKISNSGNRKCYFIGSPWILWDSWRKIVLYPKRVKLIPQVISAIMLGIIPIFFVEIMCWMAWVIL